MEEDYFEPDIYRLFENKLVNLIAILGSFKNNLSESQQRLLNVSYNPFEQIRLSSSQRIETFIRDQVLITFNLFEEVYQYEMRISDRVNEIQALNKELLIYFLMELLQNNKLLDHAKIDSFILTFFWSVRLQAKKWKISDY